jgi:hypothetical protein
MNIYIFAFIIIVMIIVSYFLYTKFSHSSSLNIPTIPTIPTITVTPKQTTKYLLTEQAIMLTFSGNYSTPYSLDIYNNLLNKNINKSILNSYSNSIPFDLNCYVLHTPVFLPNPVKRQGGYYDQTTGKVINNISENEEYYDIMGAYFFTNFNYLLNGINGTNGTPQISYYDITKQIVIDSFDLYKIFNNLNADNTYNQLAVFSQGEMPTLLDDFVPKISMFLFYGLGVNSESSYTYKNLLASC